MKKSEAGHKGSKLQRVEINISIDSLKVIDAKTRVGITYRSIVLLTQPNSTQLNHLKLYPTGSVEVERLPSEREVVSSSHSRVIPKT